MQLITLYYGMITYGYIFASLSSDVENRLVNLINEDELYFTKMMITIAIQSIIIIFAYDLHMAEFLRISYLAIVLTTILIAFNVATYQIQVKNPPVNFSGLVTF